MKDFLYAAAACLLVAGVWFASNALHFLEKRWGDSQDNAVMHSSEFPDAPSQRSKHPHQQVSLPPERSDAASHAKQEAEYPAFHSPSIGETLAARRRNCEFWMARADDNYGRMLREKACREYREYAAANNAQATLARIRPPARSADAGSRRTSSGSGISAKVYQCGQYQRGSIVYRQCRKAESRRLKYKCDEARRNDDMKARAAWCAAYESYQIVD